MRDTEATDLPERNLPSGKSDGSHAIVSLTTIPTIAVVCASLHVAKNLFLPLALGMLFAFILTPVVNALRRRGLRDLPAVVLTVQTAPPRSRPSC
ncbi:MAG: AI-2E family transporter [Tabrizicola sp.]